MTSTEIEVDDKVILTSGSTVTIDVDEDRTKVVDDNLPNTLRLNDSYEVKPKIESFTTDYTVPESTIGTLFDDIQVIRDKLVNALAGQELAIIDQITYAVDSAEGIIRKKLEELDVKYIGNDVLNQYAMTSELNTHTIANEYVIDRWTGLYIQDREDWVKGDDNDDYLAARWAKETEAEADADYPLSGLTGTLAWELSDGSIVYEDEAPDGASVHYKVMTTITSQDIYDKVVRVGHNQASYSSKIAAFADEQSAYATRTETLEATSDDIVAKLETVGGVMAGDVVYYLEDYTADDATDPVIGMVAVFSPDGYVRTDTSTFTLDDDRLEYTATLDDPVKDGWDGWAITVKSETSVLLGSIKARVNALQSQLDQTIDSWFYDGLPYYIGDDTAEELYVTSTDTLDKLRKDALVWDDTGTQMYKYVDTDDRDNVDMTAEDITDTDKYIKVWKYPESDWRTDDIDNGNDVEKDRHTADLYYDSVSGFAYRYVHEGGKYTWSKVADGALTQAMADAAKAQATADGKMSFYTGDTVPTGSTDGDDIGDVWVPSATVYAEDMYGDLVKNDDGEYVEATQAEKDDDDVQKYYKHEENAQQLFTQVDTDEYRWRDNPERSAIKDILSGATAIDNAIVGGKTISEYVSDTVSAGTDNMVKVYSGIKGNPDDETGMYSTDLVLDDGDLYITTDGIASTTYRWDTKGNDDADDNEWVEVEGASNVAALTKLNDNKKTIYYGDTAPTSSDDNPPEENDMWITDSSASDVDADIINNNIYVYVSGEWKDSSVLTSLQVTLQDEIDKRVQVIHSDTIPSEDEHKIIEDIENNLTAEEIAHYDLNLGDYWYCGTNINELYLEGYTYEYRKVPQDDSDDPLYDYVWVKTSGTALGDIAKVARGKQSIWGGDTLPTDAHVRDMWIPSDTVVIDDVTYVDGFTYTLDNDGKWKDLMKYTDNAKIDVILNADNELDPATILAGGKGTLEVFVAEQADKAVNVYSSTKGVPPELHTTSTPKLSAVLDGDMFVAHPTVKDIVVPMTYRYIAEATDAQLESAEDTNVNVVDKPYMPATDTSVWAKVGESTLSNLVDTVDGKVTIYSATWPTDADHNAVYSDIAKPRDMLIISGIDGDIEYKKHTSGMYALRYRLAKEGEDSEYVIPAKTDSTYHSKSWLYAMKGDATPGAKYIPLNRMYVGLSTEARKYVALVDRYEMHYNGETLYWLNNQWKNSEIVEKELSTHWTAGTSKFTVDDLTGAITGWSFADGSDVNSEFIIRADKFKVMGSAKGTGATPLEIVTDAEGKSEVYFKGKVKFGKSVIDTEGNTTVIDGGSITTGSIDLNQLDEQKVASDYSGTIIDKNGVRVYKNGKLRVQLGKID